MTQIGSSTPSYDANGNVTNDFLHTYSWDANGRPINIDGITIAYDAFGSMVEQNRSGTYTQIKYSPTGFKQQLMNGQSQLTSFNPLPGGAVAMYGPPNSPVFRHGDWLGSSRLTSDSTHAIYADIAYAPFGETYVPLHNSDFSFTGMNQDTVANLYDFPAREYNGIQGRWASPDPAGLSAVDDTDPQTWNRYAYVRNTPLHLVDPSGKDGMDYYDLLATGFDWEGDFGFGTSYSFYGLQVSASVGSSLMSNQDTQSIGCDASCQSDELAYATQTALFALTQPGCASAVDGGTGWAAATLGGTAELATIQQGNLGPGGNRMAETTSQFYWFGYQTHVWDAVATITLNTDPTVGFFSPTETPSGNVADNQEMGQAIILLHELGHAAVAWGYPSVMYNDAGYPGADFFSTLNNINVADACFIKGDGGQNPGPMDDPSNQPVEAARTRRRAVH
jgi:RHS repeat-associated protein